MTQIELFQQSKDSIKEEILSLVKEATPMELRLKEINRKLDELRHEYSRIDREQAEIDGRLTVVKPTKKTKMVEQVENTIDIEAIKSLGPEMLKKLIASLKEA